MKCLGFNEIFKCEIKNDEMKTINDDDEICLRNNWQSSNLPNQNQVKRN